LTDFDSKTGKNTQYTNRQIITDNASNVQKSFMLLKNLYPHLVPLNCLAHSINLLFNDIVSLESLVKLKSDS